MINELKKCKECGMPLNDKTTCDCDPKVCVHCCKCDADCECGCGCQEK